MRNIVKSFLISFVVFSVSALPVYAQGKKVTKTIEVVPGENPFTIDWQHFPAGEALLTAAGGDIKLEQKIMIQKNRE